MSRHPVPTHLGCALAWAAALALAVGCEGRPRSTGAPGEDETTSKSEAHLAELDLRDGAPETPTASLLEPGTLDTFADLLAQLREMAEQDELKGVFVRLGLAEMSFARADEIGRRLAELRRARELPVVCHADGYGNSTLLLAAQGCDELWLSPAGGVDSVGVAAQLVFGHALLERLDVQVDFLQVGKYKGAEEPFTRDSPSPEARASLETALSGIRRAWIAGVEAGRGKPASELGLESGPHSADAAQKRGLIDRIGFEDEARERALERAGVEGRVSYFGDRAGSEGGISELIRIVSGTRSLRVPHVAVVVATGSITMNGGSLFGSDGIVERKLTRVLERLAKDDSTKAVVLRIDSPGGSALASDLLWRSVMKLREKKPVVVSVGSMAASGGYYIASAATKIVAERTSILGSIGVVAGKLSFGQSLEEIGVHVEAVLPAEHDTAARALYGSPFFAWDDATRQQIRDTVERTYQLFLERIAEGRGASIEAIEPAAEGRLMAGELARDRGLVDAVGGLEQATRLAIELAEADPAIAIQVIRPPPGLLGLLSVDPAAAHAPDGPDSLAARARRIDEQLERHARKQLPATLGAGLLPFREEIEGYLGSMAPLLEGERAVAALPYVLALR